MNESVQSATDFNTIDELIKTVNQLYKDIQLQDAYQDTDEGTQEDTLKTAKSYNSGEIVEETVRTSMSYNGGEIVEEPPTGGASVLKRSVSEPIKNLPPPVAQIRKLQVTLRRLKRNLKYLKILQLEVNKEMKKQLGSLKDMSSSNLTKAALEDITKNFMGMIRKVPEKKKEKKASLEYQDGGDNRRPIVCLPAIHANEGELKRLEVFRYVENELENLEDTPLLQICLLSFAVFPENQEVNRTMLMYWWIGENILPDIDLTREILPDEEKPPGKGKKLLEKERRCWKRQEDAGKGKKLLEKARRCWKRQEDVRPHKDRPEDVVKAILNYFVERKLIEAVENKRKVNPNSYKMTPFVHSSVVLISREMGLFDMYNKGGKPRMNKSKLHKVCLVEGSSSQPEAKCKLMEPENIETVFNISERFPEFTGKWFRSMKKLKVLYLGRWERTEREIEMDSRRVMKELSSLKRLRFLSFQGISTIRSLSRHACKLTELIILDLRGCDNLEKLPDDIRKLKNLVYLDLTGCVALERIPVHLCSLQNLEVLKGFVLSDDDKASTCQLINLKDLVKLRKLRKLSITVDREHFGLNDLIQDIPGFMSLEKLKVRWGSRIPLSMKKQALEGGGVHLPEPALPKQLRKLDLQRFPDSKLPYGLQPQNLMYLEKLHLGSSKRLKGFGDLPKKPTCCCVQVLRLTCLPKLKVEWRDLKELYFPNLKFLESDKCPRVTFCPCDRDGIWRSDE